MLSGAVPQGRLSDAIESSWPSAERKVRLAAQFTKDPARKGHGAVNGLLMALDRVANVPGGPARLRT